MYNYICIWCIEYSCKQKLTSSDLLTHYWHNLDYRPMGTRIDSQVTGFSFLLCRDVRDPVFYYWNLFLTGEFLWMWLSVWFYMCSTGYHRMFHCLQIPGHGLYEPRLWIDGANGIGALKMKEMMNSLGNLLHVVIFNDGSSGKLNHMVESWLEMKSITKIGSC